MAARLPINELITQDVVDAINAGGKASGLKAARPTKSQLDPDTGDLSTYVWVDTLLNVPAPFGQLGWRLILAIGTYIREAGSVAIDQRLLVAGSDVHRAVMVDPRRLGMCHVDNVPLAPQLLPSEKIGVSAVWTYLACEYRTLRSDPTVQAPAATNELLVQGGSSLLFAPDGGGRQLRLADVRITPLVEPMVQGSRDDTNGPGRTADEVVVGHVIKYEIEGENLAPQMLAWQLSGAPVGAFDRAATPLAAVAHAVGGPDSIVMLHDADRVPVLPVASVDAVTAINGTPYAAGTDYLVDADCLAEGFVKVPKGSAIPPGLVLVGMTPAPVSGRPAFEVAAGCGFRGVARVLWRDSTGRTIFHGDVRASLVAQSVTDEPGQPARSKLHLTVLDADPAARGGVVVYPAGSVPAAGF